MYSEIWSVPYGQRDGPMLRIAHDVPLKKTTETLIDASKEIGLEINAEKPKHMFVSRHQNLGQNRDINIVSRSF
jgi:hypothetical protein